MMKQLRKKIFVCFALSAAIIAGVSTSDSVQATSNQTKSNVIEFGDPVVKRFVNKAINVENLDADITETDILKLSGSLKIGDWTNKQKSFYTIKSFKGLEKAKNMTRLHVYKNIDMQINDFTPLKKLNILQIEIFSAANLNDFTEFLDFPKLNVFKVNIANTKSFKGLSDLKQIEALAISGDPGNRTAFDPAHVASLNNNLRSLYFSDVNFTSQNIYTPFTKLTKLDVEDTNIKTEALKTINTNQKIQYPHFHYNKDLVDLSPLKNLKSIVSLGVHGNNIKDISWINLLPNLTNIYAGDNNIEDISVLKTLPNRSKLNVVYLTNNNIKDITPIKYINLVPSSVNLMYIQLDDNKITDFTPLEKFENTGAKVNATNQEYPVSDAILEDGTLLTLQDHLKKPLDYLDMNDIDTTPAEYGTFKVTNGKIFWDKVTPTNNPKYNTALATNKTNAKNVKVGMLFTQKVTSKKVEKPVISSDDYIVYDIDLDNPEQISEAKFLKDINAITDIGTKVTSDYTEQMTTLSKKGQLKVTVVTLNSKNGDINAEPKKVVVTAKTKRVEIGNEYVIYAEAFTLTITEARSTANNNELVHERSKVLAYNYKTGSKVENKDIVPDAIVIGRLKIARLPGKHNLKFDVKGDVNTTVECVVTK